VAPSVIIGVNTVIGNACAAVAMSAAVAATPSAVSVGPGPIAGKKGSNDHECRHARLPECWVHPCPLARKSHVLE
jgi:hypothetical protein